MMIHNNCVMLHIMIGIFAVSHNKKQNKIDAIKFVTDISLILMQHDAINTILQIKYEIYLKE